MEHRTSVVSGLVIGALNPRTKIDPWRLGHSYACRALGLPVADRSQHRATPLARKNPHQVIEKAQEFAKGGPLPAEAIGRI
jgi:hypothetical protein